MNLKNKKILAGKVLGVGANKISFNNERLNEISEAITRQDMVDLHNAGAIIIKEKCGRRKVEKRTSRRKAGKIKKSVFNRKKDYVTITRKLRNYLNELKGQGKISDEEYVESRKKIKTRAFKTKLQFKEYLKK